MGTRSTRGHLTAALGIALACAATIGATPARAALGYEPDATKPIIALAGDNPHGVAIDQSDQRVYVAVTSANEPAFLPGQVEQLDSNGTPTANSPFSAGGAQDLFTGVAVNPVTHGIYASRSVFSTPFGNAGQWKMNTFSATGVPGTSFDLANTPGEGPQIAADSTGAVYYPNEAANAVQVFSSTGTLQASLTCAACPGGAFSAPVSVAIGPSDAVYVVDLGTDRVVKFTRSGGSYTYASTIQSGKDAAAVAVHPTSGEVFVGSLPGEGYHVVAYDAAGVQFDDFGAGLFSNPPFGAASAGQIAVNATTNKLYVTEPVADTVRVFERVTIDPPTATSNAASAIGQLAAKLNATVNANLHAVTKCDFEYTDEADFLANGFANADTAPCSSKPTGSANTAVSASVSGLTPGTAYRHRVVATNNAGTTNGNNQAFSTLAATPPTVITDAATGVTQTGATLAGRVNPHGGAVSDCHFEYGTSISYGKSAPCPTAIGPVTTEVAQKPAISGLSPETTYHFRLVATTNAGSESGDDMEFTTPAIPPPPPPPPPTPPPAGDPAPVPPPTANPPTANPPTKRLKCKKGFVKKKVRGKVRCVKRKPRPKRS